MTPGDRVDAIRRITDALSEHGFELIDTYLDSFGISTSALRGARDTYLLRMLRAAEGPAIAQLDRHLSGPSVPPGGSDPMFEHGFRVFISHISDHKAFAVELASRLERCGVDAFVAHEQIEPGAPWIDEIERSLATCNALAALHHPGYCESAWTAQEVGWVLGRGLPVVPIRLGEDPYGLEGSVQAIQGHESKDSTHYADEIVGVLLKDPRTADQLLEVMVAALVDSRSADVSNRIIGLWGSLDAELTEAQFRLLMKSEPENGQLSGATAWPDLKLALTDQYGEFEDE